MRSLARICAVVGSLVLVACVGTVGGTQQQGTPDGGTGGGADAPPQAAAINVTGMTMDYFGAVALPSAAYTTDGMTPAMNGTSGADGSYALANVPPASSFYVSVTGGSNYRPTRDDAITVKDVSVMTNLYAVSKIDTQRQYSTLGLTPTLGTALTIVNLVRNNGTPLEGVAPADITIVDSAGKPVPGALGPYFFGPNGDVVPIATLGVSTTYNGTARMAYLDVPPGAWTVNVSYKSAQGTIMTMKVPVMTAADGVTLASTADVAAPGTPPNPTTLSFTTDVYPLLQRAAQGGQGCANCHNATMLAGGLAYDGPAATVYTKIMATPNVVVVATPATSLLLSMPLYETPPDLHPNATWLTNTDPAYMTIMQWITQGAKQ
jgi:hypothetical protein